MRQRILFLRGWPMLLLAGLCGVAPSVAGAGASAADVAVVVHPKVPVDNLSLAEVRKVLLGDKQFWTSSLRVTILMPAPEARERGVLLKRIYRMNEAQFRQYWIAKVFRQEAVSGPKTVTSNETALKLVASLPGSIAFVNAAQIASGTKVLKVNGHFPGEEGYPLQ